MQNIVKSYHERTLKNKTLNMSEIVEIIIGNADKDGGGGRDRQADIGREK